MELYTMTAVEVEVEEISTADRTAAAELLNSDRSDFDFDGPAPVEVLSEPGESIDPADDWMTDAEADALYAERLDEWGPDDVVNLGPGRHACPECCGLGVVAIGGRWFPCDRCEARPPFSVVAANVFNATVPRPGPGRPDDFDCCPGGIG